MGEYINTFVINLSDTFFSLIAIFAGLIIMSASIRVPTFTCVKQLCRMIDVEESRLVKALLVRHKRNIYSKYDGVWHRFTSMKDVIIPHKNALQYAKSLNKRARHYDPEMAILKEHDAWMKKYSPFERHAAPVLALLGHYNHGKTTLLDSLSASSYTSSEIGNITQEIRTISVQLPLAKGPEELSFKGLLEQTLFSNSAEPASIGSSEVYIPKVLSSFRSSARFKRSTLVEITDSLPVTILDTPGQDVFFRMRNYAALVADAVLLIIAADEGISLQTQESIGIVQSLNLPCIVCLNKIDKISKSEFSEKLMSLEAEIREYEKLDNCIVIPISALEKKNLQYISSAVIKLLKGDDTLVAKKESGIVSSKSFASAAHAVGVVLNTWTSSKDGTSLHVVIR